MKPLLAIAIIAVIALIGSRITFLNRSLLIGIRNILFTGTEYIFIGILLGGMGINILDNGTLIKLESFLLFGLSWVGFLYGLQFEMRLIKRLPKYYFSITAIQATITFVIVTIVIFFALVQLTLLPKAFVFLVATALGATASCTAQSAIAIVSRNYVIKDHGLLNLLRYISSVDGVFALLFFLIAISIVPESGVETFSFVSSARWIMTSVLMGIIPAIILIFLSRTKFKQQEYLVFLIGTVLFCGGLADQMGYSPLAAGFICGIVTANLCRHRLRALAVVIHAERSIYIILLLMLGAGWHFKIDESLIIACVYFFARIIGKTSGVFVATRVFKPIFKVPAKFGVGLLSEGGLVIAMVLNLRTIYPSLSDSLTTIVILSIFVNEFFSPRLILAQFTDKRLIIRKKMNST